MLEKLDPQKRLIIAAAVTFVFFIIYDLFYMPKQMPIKTEQNISKQDKNLGSAPAVDKRSAQATTAPTTPSSKAPISFEANASIARVHFMHGIFEIDKIGRISQARIKEKGRSELITLFGSGLVKPLEVRFSKEELNKLALSKTYQASTQELNATKKPQTLTLTQDLGSFSLTKTITFYPQGNYELKISTNTKEDFFITNGFRPDHEVDALSVHGALIYEADDTIETIEDADATGSQTFTQAKMISSFDRYYATIFYDFDGGMNTYFMKTNGDDPLGFVHAKDGIVIKGYIGAKNVDQLKSIDKRLVGAVEYGIFTFLAAPLFSFLNMIHSYVGNWGWAIVIFIIVVKIVLYPLSYKGMISMGKLKELSPKIKEIQAKYKKEPQKLQAAMMELYKKHGANPMGGCLPLILQIPIFFAIYRVLVNAIELRGANWFYINDLSAMDPYFILPILMGATMFIQQRLAPSSFTDPMQEKIMKYLPVVFTVFFVTFPAGLVLYWLANNILSIIQQYFVNKSMEKQRANT